MARTIRFSRVLWLLTTTWLAACGRVSFDPLGLSSNMLDASSGPGLDAVGGGGQDAPVLADAAPVPPDAAPPLDGAEPPDAPARAPILDVAPTLNFAAVCGAEPVTRQLTVKNSGTADLEITSAFADTSEFTVTDYDAVVAPARTGTITLTPRRADIGGDRSGATFSGTLTIESNAGTQTVTLQATVQGANIDNNAQNSAVNITGNPGTCPTSSVTITNSGSSTVALDQLFADGLAITGMPARLAAGASAVLTLRPTSCTSDSGGVSTVINFSASSASTANALCDETPINVNILVRASASGVCGCAS